MLNYNDNIERRSHNAGLEQLQNKLLHVASDRTLERVRFNSRAAAEQLTAATRRLGHIFYYTHSPNFILLHNWERRGGGGGWEGGGGKWEGNIRG